jgi:hypothetical protein
MESNIAQLVGQYEGGRITRRELIRSLCLLVGSAGLPSIVSAQASPHPLKATGVNHISYVGLGLRAHSRFLRRPLDS